MDPADIPSVARPQAPQKPQFDASKAKRWICLYPIYFDAAKTRTEGRRVGKEQAVLNPLARSIASACAQEGFQVYFEATKLHPKDWANPGRVRIELKSGDGRPKRSHIKNKHQLYYAVSRYLQAHPTTADMPMEMPIRGMPMPDKPPGPPAVPRGWKVNDILPLHSAAASGGGVSEDFLKDMMAEMGGQAPGGAIGAPSTSAGASKKKEKKKGKA
ncbi:signal recognition particle, SRP19 subunit [Tothia fuscella]|uniref:Signal recognition particle, SRP19 subunit n=1 Tax=Tothia fuscella TaxID=1048955 RepID=A0A9P4NUA8_9PEZI|nr:signal recognition particle, SRP19 subunit [Tothia fuscella]